MRKATVLLIVVSALVLASLAACDGEAAPANSAPSTSTSASRTATATAGPSSSPAGTPPAWTSTSVVVNRTVTVPPVPELLAIRTAAHSAEGYDRVTFDFRATLPGYEVRYVDKVIADGSGLPVDVPGRRHLQIVFRPAQAHNDSGQQAVTPRSATLDYPMMRAYAITGDYEGVLTVVLGLDDVVGFRVGELPGQPGRIYVDVAA